MDNMSTAQIFAAIGGLFVSILGAVKVPAMWDMLKTKIQVNAICKEKIQKMEMRMANMVIGVEMLLIVLETENEGDEKLKNVIAKVRELIKEPLNDSQSDG